MSARTEYTGKDRYFYPVVITQENNTLILDEAGTDYEISIPPGTYWNHLDTSITGTYPSLILEVINQINNSGVSATYAASIRDLSSGDLRYSSFRIEQSSGGGVGSWSFEFSNTANTFDPGYLGFPRESTSNQGTGNALDGTVSVLGQWISPKSAAFKTRDKSANVFRSDTGPNAVVNKWTPDTQTRMIKYHKIQAGHIYRYRAKDSATATEAGLPDNDTNNAFEDLWEGMHIGRVLAKYDASDDSNAMEFNTEDPSVSESWQVPQGGVELKDIQDKGRTWEGEHYDIEWNGVLYEAESALDGYEH